MRARLAALALLLLVAGVTRADIKFKASGGGSDCTADCTLTGTTTVDHLATAGTAPTCAITGAGAGGTCAFAGPYTGTDTAGTVQITTDASGTAATGTITITFAAAHASPVCMGILRNGAGVNWTTTATVRANSTPGTGTSCQWAWNNTSALTASDNYAFSYIVISAP